MDTSNLSVYVQGCTADGFVVGPRVYVPPADRPLYTYCPKFIAFYKVIVSYTDEKLMHQDLMTRGEFVMELLNIWETMRAKLSPNFTVINAELDTVIAYTKAAYLTEELGDITYLEKQDSSITTGINE